LVLGPGYAFDYSIKPPYHHPLMSHRIFAITLLAVLLGLPALAQTPAPATPPPQEPPATQTPSETRPGTTTTAGDTGLWFVPTGEVLPDRKWSFSLYRVNFDYDQGFTDVSDWPITFGFGLRDRVEVFGSLTVVNRIDRDVRPLFLLGATDAGGVVADYPFVTEGWTGNNIGDLRLGVKYNLMAEWRQQPAALAVRAQIKLPTGEDENASTGATDFSFDLIASKELNQRVELAGFGGFVVRGDPEGFETTNSFRWGFGAGFPTRRNLKLTAELHGESFFDDVTGAMLGQLVGEDGTLSPLVSPQAAQVNAAIGLTWLHASGFFVGGGLKWNFNMSGRSDFGSFEDQTGDSAGFQFRLGYHPGVRIYVPPPPPPPPPPPKVENRPPTVKAQCDPCTVEVGRTSTIRATATDPDGDPLTYRWSCVTGTVANPTAPTTPWTAPAQPGAVPCTVTVDDGKGGMASDTVTLQVVRPAVKEFVFEDVHFDFDRYSLRPEATRVLDEAVKALGENPELRLEIEGHTCNIGTAEYNLALGERRGQAVRDYLQSRGVGTDRLRTVSYGEERPKHDNAREETRRLNRRAAMVVRLQR
jgi:outer membrane protein OmpA-like peptidoglycan-associated protein